MKAAIFEQFRSPLVVREVADPVPHVDAAVIAVRACGICRSDWHAWMGHDDEVRLPHVPGHELAGTVVAIGDGVRSWRIGDRVTVPFCCGCGSCYECDRGNSHICDSYTQPGFTHWGAFAERVEIRFADRNLVHLPTEIDFVTAASLGCRFATSFRAIVQQGRTRAGDWVVVHGCGGVGLSAVMIAHAVGAQVIAVDIRPERLALAKELGAIVGIDATGEDVVARIVDITGRGANVSVDALGSHATCWNSIRCLAKRGRHVQIGLLLGDQSDPPIPMGTVIAKELEIYGSHGMPAADYERLLRLITSGRLLPQRLISDVVSLERGAELLTAADQFLGTGMTVIQIE
ncbi:MAG: alcohol dehydrogenase [Planctomycetaceae bacterium]|nr:MAG: alcohol dehydrogenase [Planctomycetaceae bacterium]